VQALERNPLDATLWCNRAFVRTKLEEHGYALADASACPLLFSCPG
jgi:serine/threonine-protein phosphatase 5